LYDFASVGTGSFTFAPVTTFQSAPIADKIASRSELTTVEALSSPLTIAVTGDVATHALTRRARDICTTASRKSFIDARLAA
jgi:deuterolysin